MSGFPNIVNVLSGAPGIPYTYYMKHLGSSHDKRVMIKNKS